MLKRYGRRARIYLSVAVIVLLAISGSYFTTHASPPAAIYGLSNVDLDCSNFHFQGAASPSGFAAVRIWVNDHSHTPLVDSFTSGYPGYYVTIPNSGFFTGHVAFSPQKVGTPLLAR